MTRHMTPIDARPFQARAERLNQEQLEDRYGRVAIDEVAAALHHIKAAAESLRRTPVANAA